MQRLSWIIPLEQLKVKENLHPCMFRSTAQPPRPVPLSRNMHLPMCLSVSCPGWGQTTQCPKLLCLRIQGCKCILNWLWQPVHFEWSVAHWTLSASPLSHLINDQKKDYWILSVSNCTVPPPLQRFILTKRQNLSPMYYFSHSTASSSGPVLR